MIFYLTMPKNKRKPLIIHTSPSYRWPDKEIRPTLYSARRWWAIDAPDPAFALKLASAHWAFLHSPAIQRMFKPPKALRGGRIITTSPGDASS